MRSTMWRTVIGYLLLAAVAAFILQALLRLKFPLVERLQAKTLYSALTGAAIFALLVYQWPLASWWPYWPRFRDRNVHSRGVQHRIRTLCCSACSRSFSARGRFWAKVRKYQVVELDLANTDPWLGRVDRSSLQVHANDFPKHHAHIFLTLGELPERGSDLGWGQNRSRDLVQQRLEDVVVTSVN